MTDADAFLEDFAPAPYPGLRPFEPREASIFCGREPIVDEVIEHLGSQNLVLVHGGSGCGKSSLVRAGVLPLLARRHALMGKVFSHAIMRPSEGPLGRLSTLLAEKLGLPEGAEVDGAPAQDAVRWWSDKIVFDRDIVALIEQRIEQLALQSFVLIVDQFEEIFSWARDRGRSDVDLLVGFLARVGAYETGRRLFVIVTMRSDYLGQCAQFDKLGQIINDCQYFLRNMDDANIARAITFPAAMFNGTVDPALVGRLLVAAASQPDPLPALQHSLMRMAAPHLGEPEWTLTLDDLQRVSTDSDGNESNALSVHANEVLQSLTATSSDRMTETARWIFRSLLEVDIGGKAIRRPCDFRALTSVCVASDVEADALVEAFRAEGVNLLVVSDTSNGKDPGARRVDVSHEALLRNWDRMTGDAGRKRIGWIQEEFDDALTWRMLARYATDAYSVLDSRTSLQVRPFFERMAAAPDRARRYLLRSTQQPSITNEPEWQEVDDLISRSRKRTVLWFVGSLSIAICLIAVTAYFLISYQNTLRSKQERATQSAQNLELTAVALAQRSERQVLEAQNPVDLPKGDTQQKEVGAQPSTGWSDIGASGFVWVGDTKVINLHSLSGQEIQGKDAIPGRIYVLARPLKLRTGTPQPPNQSATQIGALKINTAVVALGNAATAPNGQLWLKVRSVEVPNAYIQYTSGDADAIAALRAVLASNGFYVPSLQQLPQAQELREVRYCYQADAPKAAKVASIASSAIGGGQIGVSWIGQDGRCQTISKQGTIELWLGSITPK
jgi:hypothetical protein